MKKEKIEALKSILNMFEVNGIKAMPIKLYSDDKDIDIVIVNKRDTKKAKRILEKNSYFQKWNLSYLRELGKRMFVKKGEKYYIHFHPSISWNGLDYLDIKKVWERKILKNKIPYPSPEDEVLIIAAHSIFENKLLKQEEFDYLNKLYEKKLDWAYIKQSAKKYNWNKALKLFLSLKNKPEKPFPLLKLFKVSTNKIILDISKGKILKLPWQLFTYFIIDVFWCYRNALKRARRKK